MLGDKCERKRYIRWIKRLCIKGKEILSYKEWIKIR